MNEENNIMFGNNNNTMPDDINNMPEIIPVNWKPKQSKIKVIGVGGGGGNAVNHMFRTGIKEVEFVVCNTDEQALKKSSVLLKVQLGAVLTRGCGTGCSPEQGRQAAEESKEALDKLLSDNTEMVFITAGMGGGTGTGAAPVIAKIAREKGILTVGIVTMPFRHEGIKTFQRACDGIRELQQQVDSLLIIDNQKLCDMYGELPIPEAFAKADDILSAAAKGIAEIITLPGYINVDLADVKMVMKDSGVAIMGAGRATGEQRALEAVKQALHSPLLNDNDVSGAKNVLVNITTARNNSIKLSELQGIVEYVYDKAGNIENCKHGVVYDETMGDAVSVTIVATGFGMNALDITPPKIERIRVPFVSPDDTATNTPADDFPATIEPPAENGFTTNRYRRIYTIDPEISSPPVTARQVSAQSSGRPALIIESDTNITELEKIPAYLRRKMPLTPPAGRIDKMPARTSARIVTIDHQHRLSANNTFLYQTQD